MGMRLRAACGKCQRAENLAYQKPAAQTICNRKSISGAESSTSLFCPKALVDRCCVGKTPKLSAWPLCFQRCGDFFQFAQKHFMIIAPPGIAGNAARRIMGFWWFLVVGKRGNKQRLCAGDYTFGMVFKVLVSFQVLHGAVGARRNPFRVPFRCIMPTIRRVLDARRDAEKPQTFGGKKRFKMRLIVDWLHIAEYSSQTLRLSGEHAAVYAETST